MMNNTCPKCNGKISPFYMKQNCPHCNVNLHYYNLEENLEADARQAQAEVDAVNRFIELLKKSSVSSPVLIFRLVLFFTPLASMCLPMYNDLSLVSLIAGMINGTLEIGSVIMPVISMALVIVLSLVVIISSLFSATKTGFLRNMLFSTVNTAVFVVLGVIIGGMGVGWYLTLAIYLLEMVLQYICKKEIAKKQGVD